MCLAIPGKITEIGEFNQATVSILGVTRDVSIRLTPKAEVGSYVLIHAGFAINIIPKSEADATLDLIRQFPELAEDNIPAGVDLTTPLEA